MSSPLFGYAGEEHPRKGRPTIKRDSGGHERWADAILPADAAAGTIETPTSRKPLIVLASLVFVGVVVLTVQLFNLQIANGQRNAGLADGNRLRQTIERAPRGVIYDRNGKLLAQNLASADITATPSLLPKGPEQRQAQYVKVASLLNMKPEDVAARAEGECIAGLVAAKRSRLQAENECLNTIQTRLIAANVERNIALSFDQSSNQLTGFALDDNPIRQYNDGGALAAVLGYTGRVSENDLTDNSYTPTDFIGKLGIEAQYEQQLRGRNGGTQVEVDATGKPIKVLAAKQTKPGDNLVLTIDSELQSTLTEAIKRQMQAAGATQASGVALDPRTGEVLASVSLPTYDNNLFAKGISAKDYNKLVNDKAQPLFNKATAGAYATGSIIKPLISAAVLQEKVITPNTTVNDQGSITIKNRYDPNVSYTYRSYTDFEDGYTRKIGVVDVKRAIAVSSDVFFYTVGGGFGNIAGLGADKLTSYYRKFGLGRKPGIDIPEQTAGRVPTPESKEKSGAGAWTTGDTYNISIGQGDMVASPLQMAVAEAAFANGGKIIQPRFLKRVQGAGGQTKQTSQPKVLAENFISPEHIQTVRQGMYDATNAQYGTVCCKIAEEVPVKVAAKTGTAQTNEVANSKPNAWLTAFAPYDNPEIEIVVLIQHSGEGAKYAAPAVRETLAWCFRRPGGCVR